MKTNSSLPDQPINVCHTELLANDTREQNREKLARIMLDSLEQFIGLLDVNGKVLEINQPTLDAAGLQLSDVEGKPFWTTFWWQASEESCATLKESIARAATGEPVRWETSIYGHAGNSEPIFIDVSLVPARNEQGNVVFIAVQGRDITEKKLYEREIARQREELATLGESKAQLFNNMHASQGKFSAAFEQSPLALTITSLDDGRLVEVNESFLRLSGYTREESLGRTPNELKLWAEPEKHFKGLAKLRIGESIFGVEARFRMKNGEERIGVVGASVIEINSRPHVVSSVADITERKQAEEALRQTEDRFSKAFHASPHLMTISTLADGRYVDANDAVLRSLGYSREEMVGHTSDELGIFPYPEGRAKLADAFNHQELVRDLEINIRAKDGTIRTILLSAEIISLDGEKCILTTSNDITERKRVEEVVQQSAQQLALIADTTPVFIARCNREERFVYVNKPYAARFGLTPADCIGKRISEIVGEEAYAKFRQYVEIVLRGEAVEFEVELPYSRIGTHFTHASYAPEFDLDGNVIGWLSAITDVTERKQAEAARAHLAAIVESSDDAIISKDLMGIITSWNKGAEKIFGYTTAESIGQPVTMLIPANRVSEEPEILEKIRRGETVENYETVRRRKDSTELHISLTVSPIRDESGKVVGASKIAHDITARKQAEEALRETDRRKDEFLAMLAHELRNPLAPIRNAAQVLKLVGPADANQRWAREVIERQTQHLTRLVDDLLDVSRITRGKVTLQRELLNLTTIINRAVETSRPLIDTRKQLLTITLPAKPLYVEGDLTRLVQVVGNLLNNAAKFTEESGLIQLEVTQENGLAVIRVRDNGIGLTDDLIPHVFDLFTQADRSLDRSQGGLGIGLTLVRNLVEMHGGTVEAKSEGPGQGSEFTIWLPVIQESENGLGDENSASALGSALSTPPLKILIVEDNVDSAEMMAFILKREGHEVRMSHDGLAAVEAASAFRPQVVVCDIGLPGMNGYDVAARLLEQADFIDTMLIALSGYGQEEDRRRSREAGFKHHLVKPVDPDALVALLDSLRPDGRARN